MADDPINELVDVIDLPPLPGPHQAWEFGNAPRTYVYTAEQVRQVQREAYEAGVKAGKENR